MKIMHDFIKYAEDDNIYVNPPPLPRPPVQMVSPLLRTLIGTGIGAGAGYFGAPAGRKLEETGRAGLVGASAGLGSALGVNTARLLGSEMGYNMVDRSLPRSLAEGGLGLAGALGGGYGVDYLIDAIAKNGPKTKKRIVKKPTTLSKRASILTNSLASGYLGPVNTVSSAKDLSLAQHALIEKAHKSLGTIPALLAASTIPSSRSRKNKTKDINLDDEENNEIERIADLRESNQKLRHMSKKSSSDSNPTITKLLNILNNLNNKDYGASGRWFTDSSSPLRGIFDDERRNQEKRRRNKYANYPGCSGYMPSKKKKRNKTNKQINKIASIHAISPICAGFLDGCIDRGYSNDEIKELIIKSAQQYPTLVKHWDLVFNKLAAGPIVPRFGTGIHGTGPKLHAPDVPIVKPLHAPTPPVNVGQHASPVYKTRDGGLEQIWNRGDDVFERVEIDPVTQQPKPGGFKEQLTPEQVNKLYPEIAQTAPAGAAPAGTAFPAVAKQIDYIGADGKPQQSPATPIAGKPDHYAAKVPPAEGGEPVWSEFKYDQTTGNAALVKENIGVDIDATGQAVVHDPAVMREPLKDPLRDLPVEPKVEPEVVAPPVTTPEVPTDPTKPPGWGRRAGVGTAKWLGTTASLAVPTVGLTYAGNKGWLGGQGQGGPLNAPTPNMGKDPLFNELLNGWMKQDQAALTKTYTKWFAAHPVTTKSYPGETPETMAIKSLAVKDKLAFTGMLRDKLSMVRMAEEQAKTWAAEHNGTVEEYYASHVSPAGKFGLSENAAVTQPTGTDPNNPNAPNPDPNNPNADPNAPKSPPGKGMDLKGIWDGLNTEQQLMVGLGGPAALAGLAGTASDLTQGKLNWWGPLLTAGGLAAATWGGTQGNPGKLFSKDFWTNTKPVVPPTAPPAAVPPPPDQPLGTAPAPASFVGPPAPPAAAPTPAPTPPPPVATPPPPDQPLGPQTTGPLTIPPNLMAYNPALEGVAGLPKLGMWQGGFNKYAFSVPGLGDVPGASLPKPIPTTDMNVGKFKIPMPTLPKPAIPTPTAPIPTAPKPTLDLGNSLFRRSMSTAGPEIPTGDEQRLIEPQGDLPTWSAPQASPVKNLRTAPLSTFMGAKLPMPAQPRQLEQGMFGANLGSMPEPTLPDRGVNAEGPIPATAKTPFRSGYNSPLDFQASSPNPYSTTDITGQSSASEALNTENEQMVGGENLFGRERDYGTGPAQMGRENMNQVYRQGPEMEGEAAAKNVQGQLVNAGAQLFGIDDVNRPSVESMQKVQTEFKTKLQADAELRRKELEEPGFFEGMWKKFTGLPMHQQIMICAGLAMGLFGIGSLFTGGGGGGGGGMNMWGPLLGIGGLGLGAFGSGMIPGFNMKDLGIDKLIANIPQLIQQALGGNKPTTQVAFPEGDKPPVKPAVTGQASGTPGTPDANGKPGTTLTGNEVFDLNIDKSTTAPQVSNFANLQNMPRADVVEYARKMPEEEFNVWKENLRKQHGDAAGLMAEAWRDEGKLSGINAQQNAENLLIAGMGENAKADIPSLDQFAVHLKQVPKMGIQATSLALVDTLPPLEATANAYKMSGVYKDLDGRLRNLAYVDENPVNRKSAIETIEQSAKLKEKGVNFSSATPQQIDNTIKGLRDFYDHKDQIDRLAPDQRQPAWDKYKQELQALRAGELQQTQQSIAQKHNAASFGAIPGTVTLPPLAGSAPTTATDPTQMGPFTAEQAAKMPTPKAGPSPRIDLRGINDPSKNMFSAPGMNQLLLANDDGSMAQTVIGQLNPAQRNRMASELNKHLYWMDAGKAFSPDGTPLNAQQIAQAKTNAGSMLGMLMEGHGVKDPTTQQTTYTAYHPDPSVTQEQYVHNLNLFNENDVGKLLKEQDTQKLTALANDPHGRQLLDQKLEQYLNAEDASLANPSTQLAIKLREHMRGGASSYRPETFERLSKDIGLSLGTQGPHFRHTAIDPALENLQRGYSVNAKGEMVPSGIPGYHNRMNELAKLGYNKYGFPTTPEAWKDYETNLSSGQYNHPTLGPLRGRDYAPGYYWSHMLNQGNEKDWNRLMTSPVPGQNVDPSFVRNRLAQGVKYDDKYSVGPYSADEYAASVLRPKINPLGNGQPVDQLVDSDRQQYNELAGPPDLDRARLKRMDEVQHMINKATNQTKGDYYTRTYTPDRGEYKQAPRFAAMDEIVNRGKGESDTLGLAPTRRPVLPPDDKTIRQLAVLLSDPESEKGLEQLPATASASPSALSIPASTKPEMWHLKERQAYVDAVNRNVANPQLRQKMIKYMDARMQLSTPMSRPSAYAPVGQI